MLDGVKKIYAFPSSSLMRFSNVFTRSFSSFRRRSYNSTILSRDWCYMFVYSPILSPTLPMFDESDIVLLFFNINAHRFLNRLLNLLRKRRLPRIPSLVSRP